MLRISKLFGYGLFAVLLLAFAQPSIIDTASAAGKRQTTQEGKATYYSSKFHGRKTASGERFDQNKMMAAHRSWPFGTVVKVTNLKNGLSTEVRIADRGPSKKASQRGIIIDASRRPIRTR